MGVCENDSGGGQCAHPQHVQAEGCLTGCSIIGSRQRRGVLSRSPLLRLLFLIVAVLLATTFAGFKLYVSPAVARWREDELSEDFSGGGGLTATEEGSGYGGVGTVGRGGVERGGEGGKLEYQGMAGEGEPVVDDVGTTNDNGPTDDDHVRSVERRRVVLQQGSRASDAGAVLSSDESTVVPTTTRVTTDLASTDSSSVNLHPTEQGDGNAEMQGAPRAGRALATTALCLSGSAEFLDLTGLSILQNLVVPYQPDVDVFINLPFNCDTHKLTVLSSLVEGNQGVGVGVGAGVGGGGEGGRNSSRGFVGVRIVQRVIFSQEFLGMAGRVLSVGRGLQLETALSELSIIEGCSWVVRRREEEVGEVYKQVIWSRLDNFWSSKIDPLELPTAKTNEAVYTVPLGSRYGGHNAEFGFGSSAASHAALARVSVLHHLFENRYARLNPQRALRSQLRRKRVHVSEVALPFCRVSTRPVVLPLQRWAVPIFSIAAKGYLSGALCRPCTTLPGTEASIQEMMDILDPEWGWLGPNVSDPRLCDRTTEEEQDYDGWDLGWENSFEEAAGKVARDLQRNMDHRSFAECVEDFDSFKSKVDSWVGPGAEQACLSGFLGPLDWIGVQPFSWGVYLKNLNRSSIIYSFGVGSDVSWEKEVTQATGAEIHLFDSTPWGVQTMDSTFPVPERWHCHRELLGIDNRYLDMWMLVSEAHNEVTYAHVSPREDVLLTEGLRNRRVAAGEAAADIEDELSLQVPPSWIIWGDRPVRLRTRTLPEIMRSLTHDRVDVLKLSVEGMESYLIDDWLEMYRKGVWGPPPTCQLLIEFRTGYHRNATEVGATAVPQLQELGFVLAGCDGAPSSLRPADFLGQRCTFFSKTFCLQ